MSDGASAPVRRHRRRTVRIVTELEAGGVVERALATTLGGGGLFIETGRPLPYHAPVRIRFALQSGGPVHRVSGRVVFCHAPEDGGIGRVAGMGVEFTDPGAAACVAAELEELPG